ncbi:SARP family transcriptional regulator, partial [Streptomyces sp. NPDC059037]
TGGGGVSAARRHRVAAVAAAEQLGDPELTARVIGIYDVPAIWTRSDDPEQAAWLVGAAERTLRQLPAERHDAVRGRLLATVAVESRGTLPGEQSASGTHARALQAARQSERIARDLGDASLLAFALNGVFMQTFQRAGLAARRDAIGAELVSLSEQNNLVTYEVLGHLIRLQARSALADFAGADRHAEAADRLSQRHELPLVAVFTTWYRALRTSLTAPLPTAESAYEAAAATLEGAGMPGLRHGLLPLARLSLYVRHDETSRIDATSRIGAMDRTGAMDRIAAMDRELDWGPYEPWVRPLLLASRGDDAGARAALRDIPAPPRDLLFEALWCVVARAAVLVGDHAVMRRARTRLEPASAELAGAGSGLISCGPVSRHLDELASALARP